MSIDYREEFIKGCKKNGDTVLEVTTKQIYVIPKDHSAYSIEELKTEWFETFANKYHAFKDGCLVGGSNKVIDVKEL